MRCHPLGLRFYCGENRLRRLSDSRCCCGIGGRTGFKPNRVNLNSLVADGPIRYRPRMLEPGTAHCFKGLAQDAVSHQVLRDMSYCEAMEIAATVPTFRAVMGLDSARTML